MSVLDLGFDPDQPRDANGRFLSVGGTTTFKGKEVKVVEHIKGQNLVRIKPTGGGFDSVVKPSLLGKEVKTGPKLKKPKPTRFSLLSVGEKVKIPGGAEGKIHRILSKNKVEIKLKGGDIVPYDIKFLDFE